RWSEEISLLLEEMRHVIAFFEWKSVWWLEQSWRRELEMAEMSEAFMVYAA
ncbi:hypothetical protein PAXRUDRAFT_155586, partial [Paxillus rubicundulus Ve08.2h10]